MFKKNKKKSVPKKKKTNKNNNDIPKPKPKPNLIKKLGLINYEENLEKMNILDDKYTEKYIEHFNLNNIIILMLKEFLDKKLFPINPFPFMIKILKQTILLNNNKQIKNDFNINYTSNFLKETEIIGIFTLKKKNICYGLKNVIKILDENFINTVKANFNEYLSFNSLSENYIFCSIGGSLILNNNFIKYKLAYNNPLDINVLYFDLGVNDLFNEFALFILDDIKKITNESKMNFFKSFNIDMLEDEFYNKKYEFSLKEITLNNNYFIDFIKFILKKKSRLYCKIYLKCNDINLNYIQIRRFYYLYSEKTNPNFDLLNPLFEGVFLNLNEINYFLDFNKFQVINYKENVKYKEHIENKIIGISIPYIQQNIISLCFNLLFLLIYESDYKIEESWLQIIIILNNDNSELKEFSNKIRYNLYIINAYLKWYKNKLQNIKSNFDFELLENIIFIKLNEILNICKKLLSEDKNIEIIRFLNLIKFLMDHLKEEINNNSISKNTVYILKFLKSIFNMGKEINSQYNFNLNNKIKNFINNSFSINKIDIKYKIYFLEEFQISKNTLRTFNVENTVINYSKITDDKLIASNDDILNLLLNFYFEYTNVLPILRNIYLDLYFGQKPKNPINFIIKLLNIENQKLSFKNILTIFENLKQNYILEEGFFGKKKIQGFYFKNDGYNLKGEFLGNKIILKYLNFDKIKMIYEIIKKLNWRRGITLEMSSHDIKEIYYFKCKNLIKYTIENEFKKSTFSKIYTINCDFIFESNPLFESINILSKIIIIWIHFLNSLKDDIDGWYVIPLGIFKKKICLASLSRILLKNNNDTIQSEIIDNLKIGNRLKLKLFLKNKNLNSNYFILDLNFSILLTSKNELISPSKINIYNIFYSIFPNPDDISYLLTFFDIDKIKINRELKNKITKSLIKGKLSLSIKYNIMKSINENFENDFLDSFKIINYDSEHLIYFIEKINFCLVILNLYIINNSDELLLIKTDANNLNINFLYSEIKFLKEEIVQIFKMNETVEGDGLSIRILNLLEMVLNSLKSINQIEEEKYYFEMLKSIKKGFKKMKTFLNIMSNLYIIMNLETNKNYNLFNIIN